LLVKKLVKGKCTYTYPFVNDSKNFQKIKKIILVLLKKSFQGFRKGLHEKFRFKAFFYSYKLPIIVPQLLTLHH